MAWLDTTSSKWRDLIEAHPEILEMPCDVMGVGTVDRLLQHIVAVELRYAEQLSGLPPTEYAAIPFDSAAAIYATHERAMTMLRELLASGWGLGCEVRVCDAVDGADAGSRKTMLFHALLHAIRHYAQLATLVRQHGIKPGWQMDYLMMDVERV